MNQEDYKNQIDMWLSTLSNRMIGKFYQIVVSVLNDEKKQTEKSTFKIPIKKIKKELPDSGNNLLLNLHNKKIIVVSRTVSEPSKIYQSNGLTTILRQETINDNLAIADDPNANITLISPVFDYLAQRLLEIIKSAKNKKDIIEFCGIKYSFTTCLLSYNNGIPKELSPEKRQLKFLILLHRNRDEVVEDKDIARGVKMYSYATLSDNGKVAHEKINNKDFSEDVAALRRDCRTLLLSLGMSAEKFDMLIKRIPKKGYKLICS